MGRLLRILLTHFLWAQGGCAVRVRGRPYTFVLWYVQAPRAGQRAAGRTKPLINCNCELSSDATVESVSLNPAPTRRLLCNRQFISQSAQRILFKHCSLWTPLCFSWTTVCQLSQRPSVPSSLRPTVLIIIPLCLSGTFNLSLTLTFDCAVSAGQAEFWQLLLP